MDDRRLARSIDDLEGDRWKAIAGGRRSIRVTLSSVLSIVLSIDAASWPDHPDERSALERVRDKLESMHQASAESLEGRDWPTQG